MSGADWQWLHWFFRKVAEPSKYWGLDVGRLLRFERSQSCPAYLLHWSNLQILSVGGPFGIPPIAVWEEGCHEFWRVCVANERSNLFPPGNSTHSCCWIQVPPAPNITAYCMVYRVSYWRRSALLPYERWTTEKICRLWCRTKKIIDVNYFRPKFCDSQLQHHQALFCLLKTYALNYSSWRNRSLLD